MIKQTFKEEEFKEEETEAFQSLILSVSVSYHGSFNTH